MNKVVVACFGDRQSIDTIGELAKTAEVIAVALDFGGAATLVAIRELALAAGAVRCHALDVREEFARESLLPALRAGAYRDPTEAFVALARDYAVRKLGDIAELERATVVRPDDVVISARPLPRSFVDPVQLEIAFDNGLPISINGVPMTLTELMESIETITGEPALCVLDREMTRLRDVQLA